MTNIKRLMAATVALAAITATSACDGSKPAPTSTTSPTTTTPVATPPSTTTSLSRDQQRVTDAEATVRKFWATQDRLGQNPGVPISELLKVARGTAYDTWSKQLQVSRVQQHKQIGDTSLLQVTGVVVDAKERPTVKVMVCYDVSQVNVVDKDGKSIISPQRTSRAKSIYTVEHYQDGWFVTDDETKGEACGG